MTLAEFIKQYRIDHNMSIRAFAAFVGMSPQQILNIERGLGSSGKPMTSTMKTYSKIATAIGMTETDFLNMLNDNVLVNPSDEKIPITKSDGQYMVIDLTMLTDHQKEAIQTILDSTQPEWSAALDEVKPLLSSPQVLDDPKQS